jgi:hypothetical protein
MFLTLVTQEAQSQEIVQMAYQIRQRALEHAPDLWKARLLLNTGENHQALKFALNDKNPVSWLIDILFVLLVLLLGLLDSHSSFEFQFLSF